MNSLFKFTFDSDNEYITADRKMARWMELVHKHAYKVRIKCFVVSNYQQLYIAKRLGYVQQVQRKSISV
jgi:hypothetical protein